MRKNEVWRELGKNQTRPRLVKQEETIFEVTEEKTPHLEAMCIEEAMLKIPQLQREVVYLKIIRTVDFSGDCGYFRNIQEYCNEQISLWIRKNA